MRCNQIIVCRLFGYGNIQKHMKRFFSIVLALPMIVAVVFGVAGCIFVNPEYEYEYEPQSGYQLQMILQYVSIHNSSTLEELERDLGASIDDMLGEMDLSFLEEYLARLTDEQRQLFENQSFVATVRRILGGDNSIDYQSFSAYVVSLIFGRVTFYIPMIVTIIAVVLAMSVLKSIKGNFASKSVEDIAHFAAMSLVIILVTTHVVLLIGQTVNMITNIRDQMNVVFPILLTMMTMIGATSSVAVYQPTVVLLAGWIVNLVTVVIIPTFIFSFVFAAVGNISKHNRLSKLSEFFSAISKWMLGIVFFLFLAFLSLQGVTAAVYDGISIRTARFAISRYVPIIGGYLSEGFNLMIAGGVLIKNAVGMGAIVLLIVSILPVVINIIVFSLSLRLTAALCEPLGNERIAKYLTLVSKHMTVLLAILLGVAFLYFIFVMLIIFSGNMMF